jgi:riboflavin kinase/FMN adenylyltransferase
MKVVYGNLASKKKECVATIGVFDGIHLGHQSILKKVVKEAAKKNINSLVITFDIPPQKFLDKNFDGCITDFEEKKKLIKSLGISYLWFLKTSHSLLKLSGSEFINYILNRFPIKKLIVGEDFRFGYKGKTDINYLKKVGELYGFNLISIKKKKERGKVISSSLIRKLIAKGNFKRIRTFLGRDYSLKGEVIRGRGYGKKIGFPTANINAYGYVIPSKGVYAAYTNIGKKRYLCAINIGTRPTVAKSKKIALEAHIINFHRNIIGKTIDLFFLKKIREEKRFSSLEGLKRTIKKDIAYILKNYRLHSES